MIRKYNKLLFVNSNFYTKSKTGRFLKSKTAKPISMDGFENLDFFIHKDKLGFWAVFDGITGCRLSKLYKNFKRAIAESKKIISNFSESMLEGKIISKLKTRKLSPRYRYIVNPSLIR